VSITTYVHILNPILLLTMKIFRLFDFPRPLPDRVLMTASRDPAAAHRLSEDLSDSAQEERRQSRERRATDRREKQHSTFLNTRKTQGRRHASGRRNSDHNGSRDYRPISLKG
jgi:hypothetical protein